MDAFYASVEQRDDPSLRGKPVLVGGSPEHRGVVASASYEARKFGIRSAMSSAVARRLCPEAVFVRPHFSRYTEVSEQIRALFHEVTALVEPLSLDEAYLDVTENLLGESLAKNIAVYLKAEILKRTGLTASAGVAPNKFIAKIASDLKKPDGLVVIPPQHVQAFVAKLPIEKLWGVGPSTAKKLHSIGIYTTEDIRKTSLRELEGRVGKFAHFLMELSHGEDHRAVENDQESKSRGTESTFDRDITDPHYLLETIEEQAKEIAGELSEMERDGKTITVKIRYSDFKTITRSETLFRPTQKAEIIAQTASRLLYRNTEVGTKAVRLIGISVSGFQSRGIPEQLWLDLPLY